MSTPARDRRTVALAAADAIDRASASLPSRSALVGFDGFIDAIIHVVDQRRSMAPDDFARIPTIDQFAMRVSAASGKSTNLELVVTEERFGGNGPLMAGGLARLGLPTTYIGAVGLDDNPTQLHPVYGELARRCRKVIPLCPPARTDALEFTDGKVMLGKPANVQRVTWESIRSAMGMEGLRALVSGSGLLGIVNWVMMGGVEGVWRGLAEELLPSIPRERRPAIFIDLCDPAKRTDADVARALGLLRELNALTPVTLGLNLAEAERMDAVARAGAFDTQANATMGQALTTAASRLRGVLGLSCVVIHPREGAAASTSDGAASWFDGPFTPTPKLSTGAGDHFNAGFAFAQLLGLGLEECLACGVAVSGAYVRDALSPDLGRLTGFLRDLPAPRGR